MERKFVDIELQFRHVRLAALVVAGACVIITCWAIHSGYRHASEAENRIYILSAGQALAATATDRNDNIEIEARDHIDRFHWLFFTLEPDEKANMDGIRRAMYLADRSAKVLYDNFKEAGFYTGIVSGNISQRIRTDSIVLEMNTYPYKFREYAIQQLIRTTSITNRRLITSGTLRHVMRSDNNPHGFLIENLQVIANEDINTKTR